LQQEETAAEVHFADSNPSGLQHDYP
jgi:hypothetical protein